MKGRKGNGREEQRRRGMEMETFGAISSTTTSRKVKYDDLNEDMSMMQTKLFFEITSLSCSGFK